MRSWKTVLVIYDIEDAKVRNKVVKELESYGVRIQKSAFECYLDEGRLSAMIDHLRQIIGKQDSIRIYKPNKGVFVVSENRETDLYSQGTVIV